MQQGKTWNSFKNQTISQISCFNVFKKQESVG